MTDYSQMTDEQLAERTAGIMGWHKGWFDWFVPAIEGYFNSDGLPIISVYEWQPYDPEHVHQAVMVAEKWKSGDDHRRAEITIRPDWMIQNGETKYYVALFRSNHGLAATAEGNDLPRALVEACLMAEEGR